MHSLALAVLLAALPAASTSRTFDVPGHGQLVLSVPEGWSAEARTEADAPWPTLVLGPREGRAFSVLLTPMFDPDDRLQPALPPAVARRFAEDALRRAAPGATEKDLALKELGGPMPGWLFTASDAAPKPGEWTHATQGAAALGPFALFFTILTNGKDAPERALALDAIRSARHLPPPRPSLAPLALRFPGRTWALEVDLAGFESGPVEETRGGGVAVFSANEKTGVIASVSLDPAQGPGPGSAACEHYLSRRERVPYDRSTVERSARGEVAVIEYLIPEYEGKPLRQKNVFACLARDGVWVELHLSKARFERADRQALERILGTIRVSPDAKQGE